MRNFVPRANVRFSDAADHVRMLQPITATKVLLVADRRNGPSEPGAAPLRRYRLARLRFDGRSVNPDDRFEHLKRVYD